MDGRTLPTWIPFGVGVVIAAFGIFPLLFESFGWTTGQIFLGALIAGVVLASGLVVAKGLYHGTEPHRRAVMFGSATLAGAAALSLGIPALVHVALERIGRAGPEHWEYDDTFAVPSLAEVEPVRGTGCGGHPESAVTDTVIPDGYWFGTIQPGTGEGEVEFDLMCVYASEEDAATNPAYADQKAAGRVETLKPEDDVTWVIVDRTDRTRTVRLAPNFRYQKGEWQAGRCRPARPTELEFGVRAWLVIDDRAATLAVRQCSLAKP